MPVIDLGVYTIKPEILCSLIFFFVVVVFVQCLVLLLIHIACAWFCWRNDGKKQNEHSNTHTQNANCFFFALAACNKMKWTATRIQWRQKRNSTHIEDELKKKNREEEVNKLMEEISTKLLEKYRRQASPKDKIFNEERKMNIIWVKRQHNEMMKHKIKEKKNYTKNALQKWGHNETKNKMKEAKKKKNSRRKVCAVLFFFFYFFVHFILTRLLYHIKFIFIVDVIRFVYWIFI